MKQILTRVLSGGLMAATLALPALAYPGQSLEPNAKISLPAAEKIALTAQPGSITSAALRATTVGSGLTYSFDILPPNGGMEHVVAIDANTGKVIENVISYRYYYP